MARIQLKAWTEGKRRETVVLSGTSGCVGKNVGIDLHEGVKWFVLNLNYINERFPPGPPAIYQGRAPTDNFLRLLDSSPRVQVRLALLASWTAMFDGTPSNTSMLHSQ